MYSNEESSEEYNYENIQDDVNNTLNELDSGVELLKFLKIQDNSAVIEATVNYIIESDKFYNMIPEYVEIVLDRIADGYTVLKFLKIQENSAVREAIVNYIIKSEKFYYNIPEFVYYAVNDDQIEQLFQIVTRPENFSNWIKIVKRNGGNHILFVNSFRSYEHKKAIFDLIENTNNIHILEDDLYEWMTYFFGVDDVLGKNERERFFKWFISRNLFNSISFSSIDFTRVAIYLLNFAQYNTIKLEDLSQNILDMDNFEDMMTEIVSKFYENFRWNNSTRPSLELLKKIFQTSQEKIKLWEQFHKPEYGVLLSKQDGSQQLVPLFFIQKYQEWEKFFSFSYSSNEYSMMKEYKDYIDFDFKKPRHRLYLDYLSESYNGKNTQSLKDNTSHIEVDKFDALKKQLIEKKRCSTSYINFNRLSLNEKQLDELMDLIVRPDIFPIFIHTRAGLYILNQENNQKITLNLSQYLDALLTPHIFSKFCISWYNQGYWAYEELLATLCPLCEKYQKMDKLLPLIYANARLLILDMRELNLLKKYYPEKEVFSATDLKSTYEKADLAYEKMLLNFKRGVFKGFFFPVAPNEITMTITDLLEAKDGENMALTCHKALENANNALRNGFI